MKVGIIVIGGHIQALTIVRFCGVERIPCVVMDKTYYNIARFSKYCQKFYYCQDDGLLKLLTQLGQQRQYRDWVIFPTNDVQVELLSRNRRSLSKFYHLTVDGWNRVSTFYNKTKTYALAKKFGIPVPLTYVPRDIEKIHGLQMEYPCILKPDVMHLFFSKYRKKAVVCQNEKELMLTYARIKRELPEIELMIQEIIPGTYSAQYSVGILALNGIIYSALVAKRIRQHPIDFGNATTAAETIQDPGILKTATQLILEVGYNGVCEVEFMYDSRMDEFKLLEVNPRTWKWHGLQLPAQVSFIIKYFRFLTGEAIVPTTKWKKATWQHWITDTYVKAVLRRKKIKVRNNRNGAFIFANRCLKDPLPFVMEVLLLPYLFISRS